MSVAPTFNVIISDVVIVSVMPIIYTVTKAALGLVCVMLVLLYCFFRVRYHRILLVASKLYTGVPTYPILGHTRYYFDPDYVNLLIKTATGMMTKGEEYACLWLGPFPVICLTRADDIHTIMTSSKSAVKSLEYSLLRWGLGNGLLTSPGDIHKITRRYINPLFEPKNIEMLVAIFNNSSRHLVQDLSQLVDQGLVDILPTVTRNALRNISCVLFGSDVDIDQFTDEVEEMHNILPRMTDQAVQRIAKIWLWPDFMFYYLWSDEMKKILNGIKNYAEIYEKAHKNKLVLQENQTQEKPINFSDTFKKLQEKHPEFTEQYWQDEITTLAVTGTDTSRVVISYCLLVLALNPDIQEKLYQEIVSTMGDEDRDVTLQDVKNMSYLDQVFKESLRVTSVAPFFVRKTLEDIELKGFTLPAGSTVLVSLASLNNNPEVFPDPHLFDPDHFSPERVDRMDKNDFRTFSGGTRNCIGQTYAHVFIKIAVIQVLRKYRLSSTVDLSKLSYSFSISLYFKEGYNIKLEQRKRYESH